EKFSPFPRNLTPNFRLYIGDGHNNKQTRQGINTSASTKVRSKKMTTQSLRNSISRPLLRRGLPRKQQLPRIQAMRIIRGFLLIPLALACFALLAAPNAFGVTPAPDGGYANENTAEGSDALFSLTTGVNNTAIGFEALYYNTTGNHNTANGDG